MGVKWLIWSIEHRAWWKPAENGYTHERKEAGRYSFEDALRIVAEANRFAKDEPFEAMLPDLNG